jgi:hypothetical protein
MAVYPPPSFYSGIFDSNAFAHGNDNAGLTEDEANLLYYKYPVGQAFETLQQTDHTGLATFQAGIDLQTGTLTFPDNTVQTTAFTGGGGGETLAQTLVLGNSAGATDINMNNNDITNCATINNVIITTGVLTTNLNVGTPLSANYNLTTTGNGHNTAMGDNIMSNITTGNYNNAVGSFACQKITDGQGNEGFGSSALQDTTTGDYNVAMGNRAGEKNIGGSYNVFIGAQARENGTVGDYNTAVGQASGQADTGSYNTYIGSSTSITGGVSNSTVVGFGATTSTAHTIQLGRASVDNVNCPNTLSVASTTTMLNNLSMSSTTAIANRQISSSYYNFYATDNVGTLTYSGRLYGTLNAIVYDCPDTNSTGTSAHVFYCYNLATARNVMQLNYASASMSVPLTITTNFPASASPSLAITDSSTGNSLQVIPNVGNAYNPSADIGNIMVLGTGTQSAETLHLTNWSATNTYVKVRPTSVGIGAGGTSNTATTSVECNGTTVRITPSITFPDNSVQTTAFTGAVAGVDQMWSWNVYQITGTISGNGIRTASIVLPYSSAKTFSTSCRIEFNYAVFSNSATTQTVVPNLLSAYTGQSGGTNVNPNTVSMVDLVFNPTTQTMNAFIVQSTYSKIFTNTTTTYWRGLSGYNFVPIKFDPIAPITLNSPSAGFMTVLLDIGVPAINYSSNPNYLGNLCSIATSIRITASQATTNDTTGVATYSSGVAYFI